MFEGDLLRFSVLRFIHDWARRIGQTKLGGSQRGGPAFLRSPIGLDLTPDENLPRSRAKQMALVQIVPETLV